MNRAQILRGRFFVMSTIITIFISSLVSLPIITAADTSLNLSTIQLLPPGQNTCVAPSVVSFKSYVYDGSLDALEYTLTDPSYVAIAATVGDQTLPFQYMTRWMDPQNGNLRIHIDSAVSVSSAGTPVKVMLVSPGGMGRPTCALEIDTIVMPNEALTSTSSGTMSPPEAPTPVSSPEPTPAVSTTPEPIETAPATTVDVTATGGGATAAMGSMQDQIIAMCKDGHATALWIVLLAIYVLIVGAVTFGRKQIGIENAVEWAAAAIVVPLLLLFGFWYLAESCRTTAWVPALSILIALAGLAATFTMYTPKPPATTKVIPLPAAKSDKK